MADILITGGSAGIGRAIAAKMAEQGDRLHLVGRNRERLEKAASELDAEVFIYPCDVADTGARADLVSRVAKNSGGRLDGLVLNAARYGFTQLLEMDLEQFEHYFQVNAFSTFHLVKLCHPLLVAGEGRSVLMISSTLAARPIPGTGAYSASKAAMDSLTRTFSLELAGDKIRVNSILPGVVDTDIHEPQTDNDPPKAEKLEALGPMHPLGRVGVPNDIAEAAAFLLSDKASWITGSLFFVDGGISLV